MKVHDVERGVQVGLTIGKERARREAVSAVFPMNAVAVPPGGTATIVGEVSCPFRLERIDATAGTRDAFELVGVEVCRCSLTFERDRKGWELQPTNCAGGSVVLNVRNRTAEPQDFHASMVGFAH